MAYIIVDLGSQKIREMIIFEWEELVNQEKYYDTPTSIEYDYNFDI